VCVCVCMRYMNIKLYFYLFPFLLPTVCPVPPPLVLPCPIVLSPSSFAPLRAHKAKFIRKHFILVLILIFSFSCLPPATHRMPQLVLTETPTQAFALSLSPYLSLSLSSFLCPSLYLSMLSLFSSSLFHPLLLGYFIFYFAFCMLIRNCCCNCFHCYAQRFDAVEGGGGSEIKKKRQRNPRAKKNTKTQSTKQKQNRENWNWNRKRAKKKTSQKGYSREYRTEETLYYNHPFSPSSFHPRPC